MLNRRNFLESTGLLAASSVALCRPVFAQARPVSVPAGTADSAQLHYLKWRREFYASHDPKVFLGYPANMNGVPEAFRAWQRELHKLDLGVLPTNNVGDPFHKPAPYTTHPLEADLVTRFGTRFGFPTDDTWGFLSHSGTDSNMHGAYIGRTLLKERTGVLPKIYYTAEAHYSIQIIRDLLMLEEVLVETNPDASMNVADLEAKLQQHREAPALVIATIGTTFKGGIDDIDAIQKKLEGRAAYVHLDAALFGGYLHASPYAAEVARAGPRGKRYDSIAVSCHKFFGFHSAAGLFICGRRDFEEYRAYFEKVHDPAYISHVPGTITCSRDALKPAEFHYYCTDQALLQQQADARLVLDNARYLHAQMQRHFPHLQPERVDERSNIVYFRDAVSDGLKKKWVLATIDGSQEKGPALAHVVVMPHASREILDRFLNDLDEDQRRLQGVSVQLTSGSLPG